eukprot:3897507-Prorocentrum_lima.AAC.1
MCIRDSARAARFARQETNSNTRARKGNGKIPYLRAPHARASSRLCTATVPLRTGHLLAKAAH